MELVEPKVLCMSHPADAMLAPPYSPLTPARKDTWKQHRFPPLPDTTSENSSKRFDVKMSFFLCGLQVWHWAEVEDPTKVIFLDVDGVLDPQVNFSGEGSAGLTLDSNRFKPLQGCGL